MGAVVMLSVPAHAFTVVATVVLRWVMAGEYFGLLRIAVPQTVGQELAPRPEGGRHRSA